MKGGDKMNNNTILVPNEELGDGYYILKKVVDDGVPPTFEDMLCTAEDHFAEEEKS